MVVDKRKISRECRLSNVEKCLETLRKNNYTRAVLFLSAPVQLEPTYRTQPFYCLLSIGCRTND